jgi:serine/threonine protein kinase
MPGLPLNAVVGGKYRIEKLVGAGGMGEVYRATDLQKRRPVAVKALTLAGESGSALARFRNEAVIQWSLHHPNVAELYEYFEYQGRPCIAMEFVEGRALNEWIRDAGALEPADALRILAEICDAVSYMHSKSTIHRDIKSENIRVTAQGKAKLLDFGISVAKNTPVLTTEGHTIGTPGKMAPEQHAGSRGDARSDVWALGVLLYEMVTGAAPFPNSDPTGVRDDVTAARYIPAVKRKPSLPKPVIKMISTCLRLKPDERYASGGVMLREVQQLRRRLTGNGWKQTLSSNPAYVAGGLAVAVLLLFAYAFRPATEVKSPGGQEDPKSQSVPAEPSSGAPTRAADPADDASVRTSSESPPARPNRASAAPPMASAPAPAQSPTNSTVEPGGADQKTVRVTTYDGPAEVTNSDGQVLGRTPYSLTGPFGKSYELWLRREGFQPREVDVEINNKNEYLFGLEKIEGRPDFGKKE